MPSNVLYLFYDTLHLIYVTLLKLYGLPTKIPSTNVSADVCFNYKYINYMFPEYQ